MRRIVSLILAGVLCGCGADSDEAPLPQASPAPQNVAVPATAAPTAGDATLGGILPRPIANEAEAQACWEAAVENERSITELAGTAGEPAKLVRLPDCVASYDPDGTGYTKFYPDGVIMRFATFNERANATIRSGQRVLLHVTIHGDDLIFAESDGQNVGMLTRSSVDEPFDLTTDFEHPDQAQRIHEFCLALYEDFVKMRDGGR